MNRKDEKTIRREQNPTLRRRERKDAKMNRKDEKTIRREQNLTLRRRERKDAKMNRKDGRKDDKTRTKSNAKTQGTQRR